MDRQIVEPLQPSKGGANMLKVGVGDKLTLTSASLTLGYVEMRRSVMLSVAISVVH